MKQVISWKLLSDNTEIINKKNTACEYLPNKFLSFEDEYGKHHIDIENKTYTKTSDDYKMIINLFNSTVKFILNEKDMPTYDIKTEYEFNNKNIIIKYSIDDEEKTILINMKEA